MSCIIEFLTNSPITALANLFGIIATFIAAVFSVLNYRAVKKRKAFDEELISIAMVLEDDQNEKNSLQARIRRKNLTRAEVQGVLGTVTQGQRYNLNYLSTNQFFETLENAQVSKKIKEIKIIYTTDEAAQFKFDS